MKSLILEPVAALAGEIHLPGSKSISNRALLLAAMARGSTRLTNLLQSDDTRYMLQALKQLGITIERDADDHVIRGVAGPLVTQARTESLYLGLSGTALRPLNAALTLGCGTFRLDGTARMRERPIAHLIDALRQLGAQIDYLDAAGYAPIEVTGTGLRGGRVRMPGNISSQFLTSLLLAAPLAHGPISVDVVGEQVSKPYLDITLDMMHSFGVDARHDDYQRFTVDPGGYQSPGRFLVEGDASAATYFLAAGAIAGAGVTVHGIGSESVQGDIAFVEVLRAMGADVTLEAESVRVRPGIHQPLRGVDLDLNHIPDAAMTVAVLALFATGTTKIRNIYNWRVKETDRLQAMSRELVKVGATVVQGHDFLEIKAPQKWQSATIDTYEDHRMAMSFALCALAGEAVTINDPDCVSKTFPAFFREFASLAQH